jgi:hypothetical protein
MFLVISREVGEFLKLGSGGCTLASSATLRPQVRRLDALAGVK